MEHGAERFFVKLTSCYQLEVRGAVKHQTSTKNDSAFSDTLGYLVSWDCKKVLQGSKQSSSNCKVVPKGDQVNGLITVDIFINSVRHCYTVVVIVLWWPLSSLLWFSVLWCLQVSIRNSNIWMCAVNRNFFFKCWIDLARDVYRDCHLCKSESAYTAECQEWCLSDQENLISGELFVLSYLQRL